MKQGEKGFGGEFAVGPSACKQGERGIVKEVLLICELQLSLVRSGGKRREEKMMSGG